jgi:hypothetical protein
MNDSEEERAVPLRREELARAAAVEVGLDEWWWDRLEGETPDDLRTDARELAEIVADRIALSAHPERSSDYATFVRVSRGRAAAVEAGLGEWLWYVLEGDTPEELLASAIRLRDEFNSPAGQAAINEVVREVAETDSDMAATEAKLRQGDDPLVMATLREIRRLRGKVAVVAARVSALRIPESHVRLYAPRPRARESRPRRARAGAGTEASRDGPDEPPLDGLRLQPELLIRLALEGEAEVQFVAESYEDERRLLGWLLAADCVLDLPAVVLRLALDLLDEEGGA